MNKKNKKKANKQIRFVDGVAQVIEFEDSNDAVNSNNKKNKFSVKLSKNNAKSVIFCIIFAIFVIITPFFFEKAGVHNIAMPSNDTVFIKLWHIDSFEGGSGNRADFIERMAVNYHKENSSVYIIVQTLSPEEIENAINAGDRPDIISFSHHISTTFANFLQPLNISINCREDLLKYGQKDGETFAVPWNLSGYCLIGNSAVDSRVLTTLSCDTAYSYDAGTYNYIAGLNGSYAQVAMMKNTSTKCDLTKTADITNLTPYQAYSSFVNNSSAVLLGTARDFYRVKNRVSMGSMQECKYIPLGKFTDLVQYMGILNVEHQSQAESFIEYMTSDITQKQLANIGLFSPNGIKIHIDEDYKLFENTLSLPLESISIFATQQEKDNLYSSAINALS